MLDNLIAVLRDLQKCMEIHGAILKDNEAATRMALIDPLLRVLGWDTDNPALVIPEYSIDKGRSDYALMGQEHQKPVAVIEAKKLGSKLEDKETTQVVTYANVLGIPYAGLTDGDYWQLYDVFKQEALQDRCILDISIKADPLHQCALALLSLWQLNLASSKLVEAPRLLPHPEPADIPIPIPTPPDSAWCLLPEWETQYGRKSVPPTAIRFRNGDKQPIRYWYEILTYTVAWLMEQGILTDSNVPIYGSAVGGTRYIVHNEPIHSNGTSFTIDRDISRNGLRLFVETDYTGSNLRKNTEHLLRHCNEQPDAVQLQYQ